LSEPDKPPGSSILAALARRDGDSPLSQRSAIANGLYCHVMYKLLYPSIMVRTAPPVGLSVRVRVRVSVSFSLRILFCADLCDSGLL